MTQNRILVKVTNRENLAVGVDYFQVSATDGSQLPNWAPGAHIDLYLKNGLTRQYSLCSNPKDSQSYGFGVLNAPNSRGGSSYVHTNLNQGTELEISAPRNNFELVPAEHYIFIAGGIGITPIIAMIREVEAQGGSWELTYGGRTLDSMAMTDELSKFNDRVTLWPQDTNGLINLANLLGNPDENTAIYVCGPEPLLAAVEEICESNWPVGVLHFERFAPKPEAPKLNQAFDVELARSGKSFTVSADQTLLEALAQNGVHVISSCQEGTCGTCETGVLEGEVDHRDSVLTKQEQSLDDCLMVCVSRAACPKLVLDL